MLIWVILLFLLGIPLIMFLSLKDKGTEPKKSIGLHGLLFLVVICVAGGVFVWMLYMIFMIAFTVTGNALN